MSPERTPPLWAITVFLLALLTVRIPAALSGETSPSWLEVSVAAGASGLVALARWGFGRGIGRRGPASPTQPVRAKAIHVSPAVLAALRETATRLEGVGIDEIIAAAIFHFAGHDGDLKTKIIASVLEVLPTTLSLSGSMRCRGAQGPARRPPKPSP